MSLPFIITGVMSAITGVGVGYLLCERQANKEVEVDTFPVIFTERKKRREERERQMKEERAQERKRNMQRLTREVNDAIVTYKQDPTKDHALELLRLAIRCNEYWEGKCQYLIDQLFDDFRFSEMEILSLFENR